MIYATRSDHMREAVAAANAVQLNKRAVRLTLIGKSDRRAVIIGMQLSYKKEETIASNVYIYMSRDNYYLA